MNLFVRNPAHAKIHVLSMFSLSYESTKIILSYVLIVSYNNTVELEDYVKQLGWPIMRVVAIKPTGWTFACVAKAS